jgi:carboxypeptidase C (cathepsin A)
VIDLQRMPLVSQAVRNNLSARFYPSGHMVYLDAGSRTALKKDLDALYERTVADRPAMMRILALQERTGKASVAQARQA